LEPEIEEFLASLYLDPLCKSQMFEDLQGMIKEDMQANSTDEEENQMSIGYIEEWFQTIIRPGHHFILQHLLAPNKKDRLVPHILVYIKVYLSNLNMSSFVILLHMDPLEVLLYLRRGSHFSQVG
jgi:hypothetical protein